MKTLLIVFFSTLFLLPNAHAKIAGVVLLSKGSTFATNMKGELRSLKRRSRILEGDTLTTAANGKLQIRFIDKALLTLKGNSKLNINAYQLAKTENQSEEVLMNLITGGFRTITGSIGKGEKSAYTVNTPAASIGIRGTNYEIAQESSGEFVIAVWDGGITVTNEQGSMNVGSNSEFNFVRVKPDDEPEGLDEQPGALTDTTPAATETKQEDDEQDIKSEQAQDSESDENNESQDSENDEVSDITDTTIAPDETSETVDAAAASEGTAQESELEENIAEAEETAISISEEPFPELVTVSSIDDRFNDTEYTYLLKRPRAGLLVNVEASQSGLIENALVVQDDSNPESIGDPVISLPGSNVGTELNLDSFTLDVSSVNNTQFSSSVEGSEYVSWGRWNGAVDISSDPNNPTNTISTSKDFYWLSAEAANLSSLRGEVKFSGNEAIGDINGTSIDNLNAGFEVNFANGAIENGSLNFDNASQQWSVSFDGSVTGVNATMNNIDGSILGENSCIGCVSGDIQGIFTRPGDHFVGGFTLESDTSTTSTANGLFSIKGTAP